MTERMPKPGITVTIVGSARDRKRFEDAFAQAFGNHPLCHMAKPLPPEAPVWNDTTATFWRLLNWDMLGDFNTQLIWGPRADTLTFSPGNGPSDLDGENVIRELSKQHPGLTFRVKGNLPGRTFGYHARNGVLTNVRATLTRKREQDRRY